MTTLSTETGLRTAVPVDLDEVDLRALLVRSLIHLTLLTLSAIMVGPFVWALLTSITPPNEIFTTVRNPIPADPTIENYVNLWENHPFDRWILNSLIITTGAVFFSLLFDSLAGFVLAKGEFRGRYAVYLLVIGTLVIPPQTVIVPLYVMMGWIGWLNTYWAMMIIVVAGPFGTFMMRQFYVTVPDSMLEAARMDGCNTLQIYLRIMLPMGKPALASLAVFKFVFMWGAFLWPLIVADRSAMFPVQVGIGLLSGQYGQTLWGEVLAASLLTALPVIVAYAFAQRTFMEGIALSGGKG